jgi:hydrogenase maturation protein HypF
MVEARRIRVTGVVQGVGFRPFVVLLAGRLGLAGWVRNDSSGVDIHLEGEPAGLEEFLNRLRTEPPPLARIETLESSLVETTGCTGFTITPSLRVEGDYQPISPDIATCPDCLRELRTPGDRRYRYPFINCTNCGPRFTIIRDIPYDRPATTMAGFPLCDACAAEYGEPSDRRFHAQPVACPDCGPHLWLEVEGSRIAEREAALERARELLATGGVLAVKGLGGFHLACDATDPSAVARLRHRKRRSGKPFAVMAADLETVRHHVRLNEAEARLLESAERPVVLARRREPDPAEATSPAGPRVAEEVAPGLDTLGVMLPYTPLHHLLLEPAPGFPEVLVMTSGNLSEEPIAFEDEDARRRLGPLADALLMHDRPIHTRVDDSVTAAVGEDLYFYRRARGYAPLPLPFPLIGPPVLAAGGEMKNTFCLTRGSHAFLSHHIGEMDNLETFRSFEWSIRYYERLFRVQPEVLAWDLHPDYQATRWAQERARREGLASVGVQHHHAHIAACLLDNRLPVDRPVIGVCLDGTGYGPDGAIWGGEFLLADVHAYTRACHLAYLPLPGGDAAVRNPYRTALAWLRQAGVAWQERLAPVDEAGIEELAVLEGQLARRINTPLTSSMGRLFDAAASIAGVCQRIDYEAQGPIELEAAAAGGEEGAYPFEVGEDILDPAPAVRALAAETLRGVPLPVLSARFHNGVAGAVATVCHRLHRAHGVRQVALSGGVWQNRYLLERTIGLLAREGFEVYIHRHVPANDGGLALGQAAIAAATTT